MKFLAVSFVVRILSIVLVRTTFVPDEYWQSLEIAHFWSFGYGYRTWEWILAIRSTLHPMIFYAIYKILDFFGCDTVFNMITMPRLFQALLTTYSDYCLYQWSKKSKVMAVLVLTSWFWFYCGSRTLINTFETCLISIALRYYPWSGSQKSCTTFVVLACLVCCVRATSVLICAPLVVYHVCWLSRNPIRVLIKTYIPIGLLVLGTSIGIDSYFYRQLTISQWNFFRVNHVMNISSFYGTAPWYWYLINGLPTMLGSHYVLLIAALVRFVCNRSRYDTHRTILWLIIIGNVLIYSCLPHKESRFLLSLTPIMFYAMADISRTYRTRFWLGALLVTNTVPALYFGLVHQSGSMRLIALVEHWTSVSNPGSVLFLMPCHSTPFYSHVHRPIRMEMVTCEPNWQTDVNYVDEGKMFAADSRAWIQSRYANRLNFMFVAFFDTLAADTKQYLQTNGYEPFTTIFHTHFVNNNEGNQIIVYKRKNSA